jgi:hypothetical protein
MKDPLLRAFVMKCSGHAEAVFEPDRPPDDMETAMLAHIVAEAIDGTVSVFVCPMGPDDEVAFRVGIPRQLRAAGKFRQWCFFTEGWTAERFRTDITAPPPVKAPNRIEAMIFHAENAAGDRLSATRQIYRFPGQPARLLALVFQELPTQFVMEGNR